MLPGVILTALRGEAGETCLSSCRGSWSAATLIVFHRRKFFSSSFELASSANFEHHVVLVLAVDFCLTSSSSYHYPEQCQRLVSELWRIPVVVAAHPSLQRRRRRRDQQPPRRLSPRFWYRRLRLLPLNLLLLLPLLLFRSIPTPKLS